MTDLALASMDLSVSRSSVLLARLAQALKGDTSQVLPPLLTYY